MKPSNWINLRETAAWRKRDDFMHGEFVPGASIEFLGHPLKINRWGMRDKDYTLDEPPGVFRIAALGSSGLMGYGAAADGIFESRFEAALNASVAPEGGVRFEVLNFGTPSALGLRQLMLLREKVVGFHPDAIFYFGQQHDPKVTFNNLASAVRYGYGIPFAFVQEILDRADVAPGMLEEEFQQHLVPYRDEIMRKTYRRIVTVANAHRITPVWIYLPWPSETAVPKQALSLKLQHYAREAGFITLSLDGAYDGYDYQQLQVAEWDGHPNALAHRLLAETLYRKIYDRQKEIFGRVLLDSSHGEPLTLKERNHERDQTEGEGIHSGEVSPGRVGG